MAKSADFPCLRRIGDDGLYLPAPFHEDRQPHEGLTSVSAKRPRRGGVTDWLEGLAGLLILFGGIYGALLLAYGLSS